MFKQIPALVLTIFMSAAAAEASDTTRIHIKNLDTSDISVSQPQGQPRHREWQLTEEEKTGIQRLFQAAAEKSIDEHQGLQWTTEAASADYQVTAKLSSLAPTAPKDSFRHRHPSEAYVTRGAGSITIEFTITGNGEARNVQMRQKAGHQWHINDRFYNHSDLRRAIASLTHRLAAELAAEKPTSMDQSS